MNTGDLLAELLIAHGIDVVFGMTGGQGYALNDALHRRGPRARHVMVRDERSSAYAADAWARVSGRIGVCDAAFGVGALKLASGVAEAYNSSIPVLAILSNGPREWLLWAERGCTAQGVEQLRPFEPITKRVFQATTQSSIPAAVRHLIHVATSGRPGPVVLDIPADVFAAECAEGALDLSGRAENARVPSSRPHPDPDAIGAAAGRLETALRPVVIAGGGVAISGAAAALHEVANVWQLPVGTTIAGKGVFAETDPLGIGVVGGQYGEECANRAVAETDLVFLVGMKSSQQVTSAWTIPGRHQRVLHLDVDPTEVGKIFTTEVGIVADARSGLSALAAAAPARRPDRAAWLHRIQTLKADWQTELAAESQPLGPRVRPQYLMAELNKRLRPGDLVVSDASFAIGWIASFLDVARAGQRFIFPRGFASMGFGLPAAIGARFAQPSGKCLLVAGDGGITYAIGELSTLVKYGLDVVVVVLNNGCLGYSKFGEKLRYSGDYQSVDFPATDFATIARGFGCEGIAVTSPSAVPDALERAFKAGGPVLLDVRVDEWQTPELQLRKQLGAVHARSG
ncbi:MAG: thiamine pyrophosphate-binding protein [Rhodospirillales bacterium]|nr:thiamine pyrophosphate-binding protein [Rhodospirillales bacterium]